MGVVSEGGESIDMETEEDASHTTEPLEVIFIFNNIFDISFFVHNLYLFIYPSSRGRRILSQLIFFFIFLCGVGWKRVKNTIFFKNSKIINIGVKSNF